MSQKSILSFFKPVPSTKKTDSSGMARSQPTSQPSSKEPSQNAPDEARTARTEETQELQEQETPLTVPVSSNSKRSTSINTPPKKLRKLSASVRRKILDSDSDDDSSDDGSGSDYNPQGNASPSSSSDSDADIDIDSDDMDLESITKAKVAKKAKKPMKKVPAIPTQFAFKETSPMTSSKRERESDNNNNNNKDEEDHDSSSSSSSQDIPLDKRLKTASHSHGSEADMAMAGETSLAVFGFGSPQPPTPTSTHTHTPKNAKSIANASRLSGFVSPALSVSEDRGRSVMSPVSMDHRDGGSSTMNNVGSPSQNRYPWLIDIRDSEKRKPDEEGYDAQTLYIPQSALDKMTEFEKQYWRIKKDYWNHVLFFQKGKFYELYEVDAEIGRRELDLKVVERVNMSLAGVPLTAFEMWAAKLIGRGYKIARVDEIDTTVELNKAKRSGVKKPKVLTRKLSMVMTPGTVTDAGMLHDGAATYLLALTEDQNRDGNDGNANRGSNTTMIGVCFVDAGTGEFNLGSIECDHDRTQLEMLLLQIRPREILHVKNGLSKATIATIKRSLGSTMMMSPEQNDMDAWDWRNTSPADLLDLVKPSFEQVAIPQIVLDLASDPISLGALSGCMSYLRAMKIDKELAQQRRFRHYDPMTDGCSLIMDGKALDNLNILPSPGSSSSSKDVDGSLLGVIDQCVTQFGHRLLRTWICHPLRSIEKINQRLDAVDNLIAMSISSDFMSSLQAELTKLPDLERLVSRIHARTCRLPDFLSVLSGFDRIMSILKKVRTTPEDVLTSQLIRDLVAHCPDPQPLLDSVRASFDEAATKQALITASAPGSGSSTFNPSDGVVGVVVKTGMNDEYDEAVAQVEKIEAELQDYLKEKKKEFRISSLVYKHMGREPFQLEVPTREAKRAKLKVPTDFEVMSQTKDVKRYYTPFISERATLLAEALESLKHAHRNLFKNLQGKFAEAHHTWLEIVNRIAELDCILCLALTSKSFAANGSCRPVFVEAGTEGKGAFLDIRNGKHPILANVIGPGFVSNDTQLGCDGVAPCIVITGPNMGGKSTLLRQTATLVILAHIGCHVLADSMRLTPVDRIFTRIGASDSILTGRSTFLVELQETSQILKYATENSLVVIDELGRGTSTFDGFAIAHAVLSHLTTQLKCRTLFATHYHALCEENDSTASSLYHLAAHVESSNVTFLYKLKEGVCPRSYGMNVALLASIPQSVVDHANEIATEMDPEQAPLTEAEKRELRELIDTFA